MGAWSTSTRRCEKLELPKEYGHRADQLQQADREANPGYPGEERESQDGRTLKALILCDIPAIDTNYRLSRYRLQRSNLKRRQLHEEQLKSRNDTLDKSCLTDLPHTSNIPMNIGDSESVLEFLGSYCQVCHDPP